MQIHEVLQFLSTNKEKERKLQKTNNVGIQNIEMRVIK